MRSLSMSLFPERGGTQETGIEEIPQTPELRSKLAKETGIETVEPAAPANVKDGKRDLVVSPETQELTIELPKTQEEAASLAKGSKEDSSTWFGAQLLRTIKIALHKGLRIIFGGRT